MAFADSFVQCLSQYSITLDAGSVPDGQTTQQALDYLWNWFSSLDQDSQAAIEAATHSHAASALLDEVAPAITGLLAAFDAAVGQSLSQMVQAAHACAQQAAQASESGA